MSFSSDTWTSSIKTNQVAMKRKIAILLATNQQKSAIKELNEYLTLYVGWEKARHFFVVADCPFLSRHTASPRMRRPGSSLWTFTSRTPSMLLVSAPL